MSIERIIRAKDPTLYEADFLLWLEEQRDALRSGDQTRLDFTNLAEEIEDLGKNLKRETTSRLEVLIAHLIKLSVSDAEAPRAGWRATVREQRRQLEKLFTDSPSLRRHGEAVFEEALRHGREEARAALADQEPDKAETHAARIAKAWSTVEIGPVLDHEHYFDT